jgi:hypothetical protein
MSKLRGCGVEGCIMFDTDILIDVRPENPLEWFVPTSDVKQSSAGLRSHTFKHANQ